MYILILTIYASITQTTTPGFNDLQSCVRYGAHQLNVDDKTLKYLMFAIKGTPEGTHTSVDLPNGTFSCGKN